MQREQTGPAWVDGHAVAELVPVVDAVAALESALAGGLDPAADPHRVAVDLDGGGQLLLMPAAAERSVGVKVVTVAPQSPVIASRINAMYIYFDESLQPAAVVDGTVLTTLRTSALSALAVRRLAEPQASRLVVFGSGPQARAHVEAIRAVRPIADVRVVGRNPRTTAALVDWCGRRGVAASTATPEAVASADVVACCTTATDPLFDGDLVSGHACVVAIGSHQPTARELDERLLGRSVVVVEDVATALREAGDIVQAVAADTLDPGALIGLAELARTPIAAGRPRVFKGVGMGWQDLVVASLIVSRHLRRHGRPSPDGTARAGRVGANQPTGLSLPTTTGHSNMEVR